MPPAIYEISVAAEGSGVYSNPVRFTVAEPKRSPVSILLIYPNYLVSAGDTITVRGQRLHPDRKHDEDWFRRGKRYFLR